MDVQQPKLNNNGNFYIIYSPEKMKLRPRAGTMLNLRLKVNFPDRKEGMIGLLPGFVARKLSIENSNWISNKRKDKIIQLDILNKDFTIILISDKVKKFLINQKSCDIIYHL